MERENMTKRTVITVIIIGLVIFSVGGLWSLLENGEKEVKLNWTLRTPKEKRSDPPTIDDVLPAANSKALNWSEDAFLISAVGTETNRDIETFGWGFYPLETVASKDEQMLDGRCNFWTFYYYSPGIEEYLTFSYTDRQDGSWRDNDWSSWDRNSMRLVPLTEYIDSDEIVSYLEKDQIPPFENEETFSAHFYWLHNDVYGNPRWTIYHSNESEIDWSFELDALTGNIRRDPGIDRGLSFKGALELINDLGIAPGDEYTLLMGIGEEFSSLSLPAPTYYRGLRKPDLRRGDGCVDWWTIVWLSKVDHQSYGIKIWSDGFFTLDQGGDWSEDLHFVSDPNTTILMDSTEVMEIVSRDHSYLTNSIFFRYEINFYQYDQPITSPIWTMEYRSSDLILGFWIDGYNGTMINLSEGDY